ncbi:helix-turn-helix transcriptional regulator [Alcaligenes phenolicus]|uniref:helix-turn-helix transcriptional regulator n=1 Tax=Alcaligenes phenolicus TaxID=232846 RepID=UPI002AA87B1B|nr:helix-turn-helix transcriptional regulator [Alcaligenes phenolicus]
MLADNEHMNTLIGQIYESAQDNSLVTPIMRQICNIIGATVGHYVRLDESSGTVTASAITDRSYLEGEAAYCDYFAGIDPRLDWIGTGAVGEWRTDRQRFNADFIARNVFYNEFLFEYELQHIVCCVISQTGNQKELMGLLFPKGKAGCSEKKINTLRNLSPHFARSGTTRTQWDLLKQQNEQAQAALSLLPFGIVWLDENLQILHCNTAAQLTLQQADGLILKGHRLHTGEPSLHIALELALSSQKQQWLSILRKKTNTPLLLSIVPGGPSRLIVLIQDFMAQTQPEITLLQTAFRLTAAEARLAQALLSNYTLQEYADKAGITRNTAKTHLSSLFAKTDTRRQSELINRLQTLRSNTSKLT